MRERQQWQFLWLNTRHWWVLICTVNDNLQQQAFALFDKLITTSHPESVALSEIAELNPKRSLDKNRMARCIDMGM